MSDFIEIKTSKDIFITKISEINSVRFYFCLDRPCIEISTSKFDHIFYTSTNEEAIRVMQDIGSKLIKNPICLPFMCKSSYGGISPYVGIR